MDVTVATSGGTVRGRRRGSAATEVGVFLGVPYAQPPIGQLRSRSHRRGKVADTPTPFSPVIDGDVLPDDPWTAVGRGAAAHVPLLVGHTGDE